MAANDIQSPTHQQLECIVNRWLVDYYFFLALDAVRNDKYSDFCGIRDVLERLLYRPLECTDAMPSKIRVLQFLSRINDGEKLDLVFESDDTVTPLESAVEVLTNLSDVCSISKEDVENVCTSIKEMLVVICLKNGEFEKAKEILRKHFPFGLVGKKAILMGLANQKVRSHDILEQTNFKRFKEDMVNFSVRLFPSSEPFLYKAAKQLVDKRMVDPGEASNQGGSPVTDEGYLDSAPACEITGLASQDQFIQKKRLIAAYTALSKNSNKTTFSMLQEEQDNSTNHSGSGQGVSNAQSRLEKFFKVDSSSPKDLCVGAKQPAIDTTKPFHSTSSQVPALRQRPQRLYSVAQLVQEPDSQASTLGSTDTVDPTQDGDDDSSKVVVGSHSEKEPHSESTNKNVTLTPKSLQDLQRRVPYSSRKWASAVLEDSDSDIFNPKADCSPVRKPRKRKNISIDDDEEDDMSIIDSSCPTPPRTSPHKKGQTNGKLLSNASESKEIWSEEDSLFDLNKGQKNDTGSSNSKKPWSEKESNILKEAVARFGEGNWAKIMAKYKFENRTNVNLKDRWRTMKRLKLV